MLGVLLVIFLVAITAFFVAVEFSLVSVRRTRIEQLVSEGNASAVLVKKALDGLNGYLAAAQVGITIATLGLGTLGEPVVAQLFVPVLERVLPHEAVETFLSIHTIAFVIALFLVTVIELLIGENVPKIASIQRADTTSMLLIRPMNMFILVFKPFIWFVNMLTTGVLRLLGLPPDATHGGNVYTVEELEMLVTSSHEAGVLDRDEEAILRRVFDFGDLSAAQVMRPRTEITGVPINASLLDVLRIMSEHKHSRFPVYDGDLDNIVGMLHVRDVLTFIAQDAHMLGKAGVGAPTPPMAISNLAADGFSVRALMRPIELVPETLGVAQVLARMQKGGLQMMGVIDEYGGTAGVVTLEDVVEEILGELRDEFEPVDANAAIQVTPNGTLIDGLVPIDDVNDALGLGIESEANTLGGYVFEVLGRKPELGDEISADGYVMRVEALDNLRIAKVRIVSQKKSQEAQQDGQDPDEPGREA